MARRRKSVQDIIDQRNRIQRDLILNRVNSGPRVIFDLNTSRRYNRVTDTASRYMNNIMNNTKSGSVTKKYSRSTYMGLSNG